MGKRPGIADNSILFRVLVSFFMAIVLFVHAPLQAEAANLDVSVSFYDLGYTVEDYLPTLWGSYDSKLIGSYNVYDPSLQTYVKKDVYLWNDFVMSSTDGSSVNTNFKSTEIFYADAPFVAKPGTYPNMYFPDEATRKAHVLTAFTPSGSGSPTLGINYFPSSTGMSYSTLVPDVTVRSFQMQSTEGASLSGGSFADLEVTCTIRFNGTLPDGSFSIPLFRGSFPDDVVGSVPSVLTDSSRNSLYDAYVVNAGRSGGLVAASFSSIPYDSLLYVDCYNSSASLRFVLHYFVAEDVAPFNCVMNFQEVYPPVFRADSNVILDELQQGNADANQNAQDIMHSYDKTAQDTDNKRFEDSRKELQEQEDSLFSSAMEGFGSLDMSNYSFGRFSAMLDAFSFVSGFMQSCYVKMGDFGAIVTIGLVVMIATKVIGLYRFSTGGDSS